ncbi:MAG TPA: SgcJ/EcaC family oxidoreductase [Isosphaeraceae bacterium]|nr:SgcJ/EcaC family oxidoreductase [Isosphaeraceae bacterium]
MKKTPAIVLGLLVAVGLSCMAGGPKGGEFQAPSQVAPSADNTGRFDDEKAIRAALASFSAAFQKGDAKTIASLFTEDGEAVDADGGAIQGRQTIEEHYAARFAASPGEKMEGTIESIKFLAPAVARETGVTKHTSSGGETLTTRRYTAIHVKQGGNWLLASVREILDKELSHHERLKELEWLVGDWVEETEDAVVTTSFAWADNQNFLVRSFDVRVKGQPALTGTQRIGWDPLTKQIKSWVFDSRGGYGEGLWMRSGNQWVIKASGVRPDGRTATATQVLTFVDKDKMRWKSIDRTLGDEIMHEIDEVVMVRKPPQPKK